MNDQLVLVAIISLLVGICLGICIIALIFTVRKKIFANSLRDSDVLIGHLCMVQVPFDYASKGKISVRYHHSTKELIAITEAPHRFQKGDRAVIMNVHNNRAWIVPERYLSISSEEALEIVEPSILRPQSSTDK